MMDLTEDERAAVLAEDAKRAKRNHQMALQARGNGLMTPQDKNFILRIQLQQLVTATGGADEEGPEAALTEDFYFQVFSSIRHGQLNGPAQSHFAQTYLQQSGGRAGRRNHGQLRRLEMQVQRAVEAAKAKPKNKQLIIEGSLGKISFSNAKTPKPLLNLKQPDISDARSHTSAKDRSTGPGDLRKVVLRDIEKAYTILMKMEDHERAMPPPPREESSADEQEAFQRWRRRISEFNAELWVCLKVLEPIDSGYVLFRLI